jgi:NitT/TauT family transport system ATP-binding protein
MNIKTIDLPDYKEQSPEVKARFDEIKTRPKILEVQKLNKIFQTGKKEIQALKDIDFALHRREFVSVIGPSGCGKSTIIRILAGLEIQSSGSVLVAGHEVSGPGPDRGMVFQSYTLFPWLTVKKNVMFGLELQGNGDAEEEARQWIQLVGLSQFENAYPNQLSGGMKQRVAIARALANQPSILLMDEPFGALDAQTRAQMQSYLLQIWRNVNITIVFITHDLDEAVYLSDRIIVLKANPGEISEIVENPVPRPRVVDQFLSPEFLSVKNRLEELIHPKKEIMQSQLPIIQLTDVDDKAE